MKMRHHLRFYGMILTIMFSMLLGGEMISQADPVTLNEGAAGNPYGTWSNGPASNPDYFPIAVWLQSPHNATRFKEAGFNLYIGLWEGPTEDQLAALKDADMPVICAQNEVALSQLDNPLIIGRMHGDEPDNAQAVPEGGCRNVEIVAIAG